MIHLEFIAERQTCQLAALVYELSTGEPPSLLGEVMLTDTQGMMLTILASRLNDFVCLTDKRPQWSCERVEQHVQAIRKELAICFPDSHEILQISESTCAYGLFVDSVNFHPRFTISLESRFQGDKLCLKYSDFKPLLLLDVAQ